MLPPRTPLSAPTAVDFTALHSFSFQSFFSSILKLDPGVAIIPFLPPPRPFTGLGPSGRRKLSRVRAEDCLPTPPGALHPPSSRFLPPSSQSFRLSTPPRPEYGLGPDSTGLLSRLQPCCCSLSSILIFSISVLASSTAAPLPASLSRTCASLRTLPVKIVKSAQFG